MSPLRRALDDYLQVRRALGFRLERAEKLLGQFITYLDDHHAVTVTTEDALAWATLPGGAPWWHALRLSAIRPFAAWLHAVDDRAEVLPAGLIPAGPHRAAPYLYSGTEITALTTAAGRLPRRVNALTYPVLISLLAVTGMRIGEAISLNDADFDPGAGILTVRQGKFGKARLLPLHPTVTAALGGYQQARDRLRPQRASDALLISSAGTRLHYNRTSQTFRRLASQAGLAPAHRDAGPGSMIFGTASRSPACWTATAPAATRRPCCPGWRPTSATPIPSTRSGTSPARPNCSPWPPPASRPAPERTRDHPGPDPAGILH